MKQTKEEFLARIKAQNEAKENLERSCANKGDFDFIEAYTEYADVYEVSKEVHEAVALAMLAGVANRNVWIDWGTSIPLDAWFLITTGSGGGRNTAIRKCRTILKLARVEHLVQDIAWGSEAIVKQHFAENPSGIFIWPEVSEQLLDLTKPAFVGVKQWLTNLYDETELPPSKIYRRTSNSKKKNTPPIEFREAPRTNFIASSSVEWLMQNLTRVDSTGGFLARWIHVHADGTGRLVHKPVPTDKKLEAPLGKRLSEVAQLDGTADLSQVEEIYRDWYEAPARRFEKQPNKDLATAYFNRHRVHVLKLAVLFEMSRSATLVVTPESMNRAIKFAGKVERHIFKLLPTGFEQSGYELEKMLERIKQGGAEGMALSDFTQAFKNVPGYIRTDRLKTLHEAGDIRIFQRVTGGRAARILVYRDSVEEYKTNHPEDKELNTLS